MSKTRSEMVREIVNDLEDWLNRDSEGFWTHMRMLEKVHLSHMPIERLKSLYEDIFN